MATVAIWRTLRIQFYVNSLATPNICGVLLVTRTVGLELRYPTPEIESEPLWGGVRIRIWALALLIFLDSAIVLRIISGSILSLFEYGCSSTKAFYFVNQLGWPIGALLWGIGLIITLQFFLFALEPEVYKWVRIIFLMIIVLSCAAIVHLVLVKLILSSFSVVEFRVFVLTSLLTILPRFL
jgi:hypothetical protein